eukprot:scaffold965_cov93-Cylindrotheca_fusiformis.AAC.8
MDQNNKRKRSEIGDPNFFVYSSETTDMDIPRTTLTHLRLDCSVTEIPDGEFQNCEALVHVRLPETLTTIGQAAFHNCPKLQYVNFASNPSLEASSSSCHQNSRDGLLEFPKTATLQIGATAFSWCSSLRKVIVSSVSTILGNGAFKDCNGLISVSLPPGLQVIEDSLFSDCESLTTVTIPSSVIKIGDHAFKNCRSLTTFELPQRLLQIGKYSFVSCCSVETLQIPSTVVAIGDSAFYSCERLKSIKLPPTLEIIEDCLFNCCYELEYIEIPTTVKKICDNVFSRCTSLSHIRIPPSVGYIGRSAFSYCAELISLELPDRSFSTDDTEDSWFSGGVSEGIYMCNTLVNVVANPGLSGDTGEMMMSHPVLIGNRACLEEFLQDSKIGSVVDGYDGFLHKLIHRFDQSPLNKLCYYQSYYSLEDAMVKLRSLMEEDTLTATTQVDEFGMTPLHILSLSQTLNLSMLLAVIDGGPRDHILRCRDSFGSTPMDYLCLNKMPNSTQLIRSLLQATFVKRVDWLGLERWRSDLLQAVDEALVVDRSSRSREIGMVCFKLANYERKEILSLLELYLWNVKIDEVSSEKDGADRESCRINSGASIVIPPVLLFLGNFDMEDYFSSAP